MYLTQISKGNWCLGQISIIHMGTIAQLLVGNADDCAWTEKISIAHEYGCSLIVITWSRI